MIRWGEADALEPGEALPGPEPLPDALRRSSWARRCHAEASDEPSRSYYLQEEEWWDREAAREEAHDKARLLLEDLREEWNPTW